MRVILSCCFTTLRGTDLENVFLSDMQNLGGIGQHFHCQWQVSTSELWEFVSVNSDAIIWKMKHFLPIFCFISGISIRFWTIWKKKMMVIANVFPKLKTVKDVLRQISKKTGFKTPFDSLHVQGSQTLVKAARKPFCQIFSSLWGKLIWKMSPLVICETEGRLLTYWVLMTRMLFRIVRICCSEHKRNYKGKQKTFSQYLLPFLKYTSNFKHFEEKYDRHVYCMSEIKGCQRFS